MGEERTLAMCHPCQSQPSGCDSASSWLSMHSGCFQISLGATDSLSGNWMRWKMPRHLEPPRSWSVRSSWVRLTAKDITENSVEISFYRRGLIFSLNRACLCEWFLLGPQVVEEEGICMCWSKFDILSVTIMLVQFIKVRISSAVALCP